MSKQPRAINLVSVSMYAMLAAGVYCGIKFGIPYYKNWEVSGVLADTKREAGRFIPGTGDPREESVLGKLRQQVVDIGIDDPGLQIYFGVNDDTLHVDYTVIIDHPYFDPTVWEIRHEEAIVPVNR